MDSSSLQVKRASLEKYLPELCLDSVLSQYKGIDLGGPSSPMCIWFVRQGFGGGWAMGVASVRSC